MRATYQGRYSTYEIRVRAVAAVSRGLPVGEVAAAYHIDRSTRFRWITRHRVNSRDGLLRKVGSGRPRLLADLDEGALWDIVLRPATTFGFETDLWTIGRVHQVVQEEYETTVSQDTIWRRLRDAGLTYQKPERQYFQVDEEARKEWLRTEAPRIRQPCGNAKRCSISRTRQTSP